MCAEKLFSALSSHTALPPCPPLPSPRLPQPTRLNRPSLPYLSSSESMLSGAGKTQGARALESCPQHSLLTRHERPLVEQHPQETVGLEMAEEPVSYSSSTPSESDPGVEMKRVSGCWSAGSGVGGRWWGLSAPQKTNRKNKRTPKDVTFGHSRLVTRPQTAHVSCYFLASASHVGGTAVPRRSRRETAPVNRMPR